MDPEEYRRRIDELSKLIGLGKELEVNVSPAETLLRRALKDYSTGNGDAARTKMENGLRSVRDALGPVVNRRVLRCRRIIDGHRQRGLDVSKAERIADLAMEAYKEGRLLEASERERAASRAMDEAIARYQVELEKVRFGEWLLATMAWVQGVTGPQDTVEVEDPATLSPAKRECVETVDHIHESAVEVLRNDFPKLLDRAQRQVAGMRFREGDTARPSMDYLAAADYLEMARRRLDRGSDEDLMVALEYIYEVHERSEGGGDPGR